MSILPRHPNPSPLLTFACSKSGFLQLLPISLFVAVFGAAFGLAASQAGLSPFSTTIMSLTVFAGYAQFAVIALWGHPISLLTLIATVFAINARHLLMGASLSPWLHTLPPVKRYGILTVLSDANWAVAVKEFALGRSGLGALFGGGLALWLAWNLGTLVGVYVGQDLQDLHRFGLDMVMGCFILSMVFEEKQNCNTLLIGLSAAGASLLAYHFGPQNSHIIVGAIAGGIMGMLVRGRDVN